MPKVIGEIIQNGGEFPVVDANNIRGGVYSVSSTTDMNKIPDLRKKEGMLCYVQAEKQYYNYINGSWQRTSFSGGSSSCNCPAIDPTLSDTSENPVQNKAIYAKIKELEAAIKNLQDNGGNSGGDTDDETFELVVTPSSTSITSGQSVTLTWKLVGDKGTEIINGFDSTVDGSSVRGNSYTNTLTGIAGTTLTHTYNVKVVYNGTT